MCYKSEACEVVILVTEVVKLAAKRVVNEMNGKMKNLASSDAA